jgi:hypothetical protein
MEQISSPKLIYKKILGFIKSCFIFVPETKPENMTILNRKNVFTINEEIGDGRHALYKLYYGEAIVGRNIMVEVYKANGGLHPVHYSYLKALQKHIEDKYRSVFPDPLVIVTMSDDMLRIREQLNFVGAVSKTNDVPLNKYTDYVSRNQLLRAYKYFEEHFEPLRKQYHAEMTAAYQGRLVKEYQGASARVEKIGRDTLEVLVHGTIPQEELEEMDRDIRRDIRNNYKLTMKIIIQNEALAHRL